MHGETMKNFFYLQYKLQSKHCRLLCVKCNICHTIQSVFMEHTADIT